MPRSRGAASGFLLIVLGIWGAAVPFVGPSFDFAFSPGRDWSTARGWLEVLPGAAAALGGALLRSSSAHLRPLAIFFILAIHERSAIW